MTGEGASNERVDLAREGEIGIGDAAGGVR